MLDFCIAFNWFLVLTSFSDNGMAGKINSRCVGHGKLHRRMAGVFDLIALSVGYLGYCVFHRSARGSKYLQLVAQQELVPLLRIYAAVFALIHHSAHIIGADLSAVLIILSAL